LESDLRQPAISARLGNLRERRAQASVVETPERVVKRVTVI
jgi:hypothetical protein